MASHIPLFQATELSKKYGEYPAVQNISLEVEKGETLAIVGPSGSGKTTLLRILACLESPDEGSIYLDGEILPDPAEALVAGHSQIRMVHQHFNLAPNRTVRENISMLLRNYRANFQKAETERLMEVFHISHLADRQVNALSGGEKQRLAIARAMADDSSILLLDEPFSQQDASLKFNMIRALMAEVNQSGKGIVLVTHDPLEAMGLGSKVSALTGGSIVQTGLPETLYNRPLNAEVARLMGRINIFPGDTWNIILDNTEHDGQAGYRPENLEITKAEKGPFHVEEIIYQGAFSEIVLTSEEITLYVKSTRVAVTKGDLVEISARSATRIPL